MKNAFFVFAALTFVFLLTQTAFAQTPEPKIINGGIINGKAISLPKPVYPEEAKAAKIEGKVFVDVLIDEDGNVISALAATDARKVYKMQDMQEVASEIPPADPLLRAAAEKAALEAKFSPTRLNDVPVKVRGTITYNFVADDSVAPGSPKIVNGGGVINGKAKSLPRPEYPPAARAVRAGGTVMVQVTIDENGDIVSASAVSGHPLLRPAAVKAAREAKFAPTSVDGNPVRVTGVLVYNFVPPPERGT